MNKHEQRETLNEQARAARDAEQVAREAAQAAPRKRRGRERCSWLLSSTSAPPAKQNWKKKGYQESGNVDCVQVMNMTFLPARSAGCARTMDIGHRIVQRRGRRIETRGTENRRGEGG